MSFEPARGYSWRPSQENNLMALRHGISSPRIIDAAATKIAEELFDTCPGSVQTSQALLTSRRPCRSEPAQTSLPGSYSVSETSAQHDPLTGNGQSHGSVIRQAAPRDRSSRSAGVSRRESP